MPHQFSLNSESLKRTFAVYVVVIGHRRKSLLYVGKTGDNRAGCNPVVSRCGNHFSHNKTHSQLRNALLKRGIDPAKCRFTYVFDHFGDYLDGARNRHLHVARVNEMERWLNQEVQKLIADRQNVELVNQYMARGHLSASKAAARFRLRDKSSQRKIRDLVAAVKALLE